MKIKVGDNGMKLQELDETRKNIIEFQGEINGFDCAVIFQTLGHRCGYVKLNENSRFAELENEQLDEIFDVHGGITWDSGSPIFAQNNNSKWIGFDCAHFNDRPDLETLIKYNDIFELGAEQYIQFTQQYLLAYGEIRTLNYVIDELKSLTKQLQEKANE